MSNYFTTNQKRRKTHWQIPMWIDKTCLGDTYNSKGDLVAVTDTSNATVQFTYLTDPKALEH